MTASSSVTQAELEADPHDALRRLRDEGPISPSPAGGWLVLSRELADLVLRDDERFTVDDPRFSTGRVVGPSMLSLDGPEHLRHRQPFPEWFGRRRLDAELGEWLAEWCDDRLALLQQRPSADLAAELARPLAIAAVTRALGLDDAAERDLDGWYTAIVAAVTAGGRRDPAAARAMTSLGRAVARATAREQHPLLVGAEASLGADALVSNLAVSLFGGIETAEGMISNLLWHVATEDGLAAALGAEEVTSAAVIDESTRLEPAAMSVHRYATEPVDVGGVRIDRGDFVDVSLAAANRDPDMFDQPDRFDASRGNLGAQLTFARGPHACFGVHLAKLEAAVALEGWLRVADQAELVDDGGGPTGHIFRKPPTLVVRWVETP